MSGIVLLAGQGEPTHIIYHGLRRDFEIARVILEDPVPRGQFLKRRLKKLGARKVAGQIFFRALMVP